MSAILQDKACLIIGASQGIGAAVVEEFINQGARLVIAARNLEKMEALARPYRDKGNDIHAVRMDISDPQQVVAGVDFTLEKLGRLDVAVNNAAVQSPVYLPFGDIELEEFDRIVDTNLRGTFVAMKAQINAMLKSGGGSIVNISSLGGFIGFPRMGSYVASKHGIVGLTKVAALDYAKQNIRVNTVAPGAVMTEMIAKGTASTPEGKALIESKVPAGRIGAPLEIAKAAAWLASDAASYVTGITMPVDGGYSIP
ncbi:MAG: SDR family oxidoreductase [Porticoccaceae bacterium]